MKKIKEYEIYPTSFGVSCYSKYYNGVLWKIRSISIRQAYYFASNYIWMEDENDLGIKEEYLREKGHLDWKVKKEGGKHGYS